MALLANALQFAGIAKERKAAKKQLALEREQFAYAKQLAERQQALAEDLNRQGKATQVDADGNVTYYDAASNTWKSVLSLDQQQLNDASNAEQLKQYTSDATAAREERGAAAGMRGQERATASSLGDELYRLRSGADQPGAASLASALRLGRTQALSRGFDDAQATIGMQALRSGGMGLDRLGGALAKAKAQQYAATMGNPEVEGLQLADQRKSSQIADTSNLYNMFASRAANIGNASFAPANVGSTLAQALASARAGGLAATGNAAGAIANSGVGVQNAANRVNFTNKGAGAMYTAAGDLVTKYEDQIGAMFDPITAMFSKRTKSTPKQGSFEYGNFG